MDYYPRGIPPATRHAKQTMRSIEKKAKSQEDWDLLNEMNKSMKSRIGIPALEPGNIRQQVLHAIFWRCKDQGAKTRLIRSLQRADRLGPVPSRG